MRRSRHLLGGDQQHRLHRRLAQSPHQLLHRQPPLFDQLHHRHQRRPLLRQKLAQRGTTYPLMTDRVRILTAGISSGGCGRAPVTC